MQNKKVQRPTKAVPNKNLARNNSNEVISMVLVSHNQRGVGAYQYNGKTFPYDSNIKPPYFNKG